MQSKSTVKFTESPFSKTTLDTIFKQEIVSLSICQQSYSLYRQDYLSLLGQNWLRTEAVDILLKLLVEQSRREASKIWAGIGELAQEQHHQYVKLIDAFIGTMIMTVDQEPILESLASLQFFSPLTRYLLIPINTQYAHGQHWVFGLFKNGNYKTKIEKSQLWIFDSGKSGGKIGQDLMQRLKRLKLILSKQQMQVVIRYPESVPVQTNSYDCGIFTVGFGEYVLKEIMQELEQGANEIRLNRLNSQYKYLLGNSGLARDRYRRMLEQRLLLLLD